MNYEPPTWAEVEEMNKATKRFINDLKRLFGPQNYQARLVDILGTELAHAIVGGEMQTVRVVNNWLLTHLRDQMTDPAETCEVVLQLFAVRQDQLEQVHAALARQLQ